MASSPNHCALQVKKEKKNENLARYYRLQDEVWATDRFVTLPRGIAACIPSGLSSLIMLQDGGAPDGEPQEPTADGKAADAKKPAKKSKQAAAAAPQSSELPDQEQKEAKPPKASRLISSTPKQGPTTEAGPPSEPPSESDEEVAEAEVQSESGEESEEEDEAEAEASKRWARMRGLAGSESSSEGEGGSDSDTDAELPAVADDEEVKTLAEGLKGTAYPLQ